MADDGIFTIHEQLPSGDPSTAAVVTETAPEDAYTYDSARKGYVVPYTEPIKGGSKGTQVVVVNETDANGRLVPVGSYSIGNKSNTTPVPAAQQGKRRKGKASAVVETVAPTVIAPPAPVRPRTHATLQGQFGEIKLPLRAAFQDQGFIVLVSDPDSGFSYIPPAGRDIFTVVLANGDVAKVVYAGISFIRPDTHERHLVLLNVEDEDNG